MSIEREQNLIVQKLTEQMKNAGIDVLLLTAGDDIFYATGFADRNLYRGGAIGNAVAVVTKDGQTGLVVSEFARQAAEQAVKNVEIISYPTWIYIADYAKHETQKDVQPDLNKTYKLALQIIPDNYGKTKVGVRKSHLTYTAYQFLSEKFGAENIADAGQVLIEAKAVKTPWEISLLRQAAHYSEIAMNRVSKEVIPGMTEADVVQLFNTISFSLSPEVAFVSNAHTIGANFTPAFLRPFTRLNRGDLIRLDGGPNVKGYNSDLARTFAVGTSTRKEWEDLYAHLWAGYEFAVNNIGPGVKMSDIFNGIHQLLKERHFEGYVRGHQGHSLGCGLTGEEYPFIAPGESRVFEPGMVMNIEMPYYSSKNQTYNIEDTFLVTDTGIELFTKASDSLYV